MVEEKVPSGINLHLKIIKNTWPTLGCESPPTVQVYDNIVLHLGGTARAGPAADQMLEPLFIV
ncbi:hypothetical protein WN55_00343 [Dufourea novaeangliae]|uniref:Uncharacterized protein n=1 Tax=Dufourea novaeangliae TaxID=178035 RepID=A0A154PFH5_DUFNO|nr:hypothetical protein WN55_00343 [Dufourea novaeangliae]